MSEHPRKQRMNRISRRMTIGATAALAFLAMSAMTRQGVEQFSRLEIVRDGHAVISLNTDENGGVIRLFNAAGAEALALRIGDDGGADIRINDRAGLPALTVRTGEKTLRIATETSGRERLVPLFPGAAPGGDRPDEATETTVEVLDLRIDNLESALQALRREYDDLDRDLRDIRPGLKPGTTFDRMDRTLQQLQREQTAFERDLRQLSSDLDREGRAVDDLRRRVSRLENRIP